jgi:hypothetical protein
MWVWWMGLSTVRMGEVGLAEQRATTRLAAMGLRMGRTTRMKLSAAMRRRLLPTTWMGVQWMETEATPKPPEMMTKMKPELESEPDEMP